MFQNSPTNFTFQFLVVINPIYRGKGLGRLLMDGCEQLAAGLGLSAAFLSTHDQQGFYAKIGYEFCDPICHFGAGGSQTTSIKVINCITNFYRNLPIIHFALLIA